VDGVQNVSAELYEDPTSRIITAGLGKFAVIQYGGILDAMREINKFAGSGQIDRKIKFPVASVKVIKVDKRTLLGLTTKSEVVDALNEEREAARKLTAAEGGHSMFDMIPVARTYDHEKAIYIARSLTELFEADSSTANLTLSRPIPKILTWNNTNTR
jgi:hypothetical protein